MSKLIKKPYEIQNDENIIFHSKTTDYKITMDDVTGEFFCYGVSRSNLKNYLLPVITIKTSLQTGAFFKSHAMFHEINKIYNIKDENIYYELRLTENNNEEVLFFLFEDEQDIRNFSIYLMHLAFKIKKTYFLNKKNQKKD